VASNGRLPAAAIAPIPGGYLERTAALYWNALVAEAKRRYGVLLHPLGSMSSYRTYAQQVYLRQLYLSGRGNLAAIPGTSNHGLGLAVDLASQQMRWIVDQIGRHFGFSKGCSDAPSEWWHLLWNPRCTGATWRPPRAQPLPTLRRGMRGHEDTIKKLQLILRKRGHKGVRVNGNYDLATRRAIRAIQRKYRLTPVDGVCGPRTWRIVLR
jgi:hypothetical protein